MFNQLKKLFLRPSKKNPLVKRWQKIVEDSGPVEELVYDAFEDKQIYSIPDSPFMDYPEFRRIVEAQTRLGDIQEKVRNSYIVVADRKHPIYDLNASETPTPFTYWDTNGRSVIVTSDNMRRDFPSLAQSLGDNAEAQVAVHELAHAWDIGLLGKKIPGVSGGGRPLSSVIMKDSLGFLGGRPPELKDAKRLEGLEPRLRRMGVHPIEVPAVLTEVAAYNPDAFREVVDANPWTEKFLNMFYGNTYGSRAYGPRGVEK